MRVFARQPLSSAVQQIIRGNRWVRHQRVDACARHSWRGGHPYDGHMGSKTICNAMMGLVTLTLVIAACSSPPAELRWPPPATPAWPSTPVTWRGPATALVCRVADVADEGVGVYYLDIHSGAFDFSPCDSGTARIPIRVGDPQRPLGEGLQQRCMYGAATDPSVNGYVNVLSSARPSDILSANRLCTAHHGIVR